MTTPTNNSQDFSAEEFFSSLHLSSREKGPLEPKKLQGILDSAEEEFKMPKNASPQRNHLLLCNFKKTLIFSRSVNNESIG